MHAGARWLHVVDLDRAFGTGSNSEIVRSLVHQLGSRAQVQLGGGFRTLELVRTAVEFGAAAILESTLIRGASQYGLIIDSYDDIVILESENGAQTKWARQAISQRVDPVDELVVASPDPERLAGWVQRFTAAAVRQVPAADW